MPSPKDRIKERREALGLTQLELALRMGYTDRSTIAKIESGTNDVNHKKLEAFAAALQTTVSYLLGLVEDSYDYDRDPENRRSEIPQEIYNTLEPRFHGDLRGIWEEWQHMEQAPKSDLNPLPSLTEEKLKFALFDGQEDITDEMYAEVKQFAKFVLMREKGKAKKE